MARMRLENSTVFTIGLALLGAGCTVEPDDSSDSSWALTAYQGLDDDDDNASESGAASGSGVTTAGDPPPGGGTDPGEPGSQSGSSSDGDEHPSTGSSEEGSTGASELPDPSPYAGGWDVGDCQDAVPTGAGFAGDISGRDQFGESVRLHDFCHKAVVVVVGSFT